MASQAYVLGLDVGTQSLRAAIIDSQGQCRAYGVGEFHTSHPHPGWAEQDAAAWWRAAASACKHALDEAGLSGADIRAIGLDATACTVIPSRGDGTPLRACLLWMDQRAFRESAEINATGHPALRYVSGTVSPEWMLPKALWLKRNETELYNRTERLVECTDWFMYKLTGQWTGSLNNVTVKWNYAKPDGGWDDELLRIVGLEDVRQKWPEQVVTLGQGDGTLTPEAGRHLGLEEGTPVAQGGIDAYLGMLGLGAVKPGDLALIMGSSTCHIALSRDPVLGSGLAGCYPEAVSPGLWVLEGGQTATGSIVNWYRQHFAGNEEAEAGQAGRNVYEILDAKAAEVPPGCDGLVCLDYWQGNRCPIKDPRARGAIWGLSLSHGPGHVFRAIYEGTAFGTRHILEDAAQHGFEVGRIFAGGGGAKSRLWLQIHADVCQMPIYLTRETESCALGSAMTAAVRCGLYASLEEAAEKMVTVDTVIEPSLEQRDVYNDRFQEYLATYEQLKQLMHEMADKTS